MTVGLANCPPKMVYCTYCGKSFSRKEHLERHIPSHTNVKPHRCSACQLSFARRDLLQRHYATYHEARDPTDSLSSTGVSSVAGRTPIACQNCASAKTGCDKKVPCSRCAEKNLVCTARFARRAPKAAVRAAQAKLQQAAHLELQVNPSLLSSTPKIPPPSHPQPQGQAQSPDVIFPDTAILLDRHMVESFHASHTSQPPQIPPVQISTSSPAIISITSSMNPMVDGESMVDSSSTIFPLNTMLGGLPSPNGFTSPTNMFSFMQQQQQQQHHLQHQPISTSLPQSQQHAHSQQQTSVWPGLDEVFRVNGDDMTFTVVSATDPSLWFQDAQSFSGFPLLMQNSMDVMDTRKSEVTDNMGPSTGFPTAWPDPESLPSSSRPSSHSNGVGQIRETSISSLADMDISLAIPYHGQMSIQEFDVVIQAEAAWPLARCTPTTYSGACPRTAVVHLESLEIKSKEDGAWLPMERYLEQIGWDQPGLASVVPMTSRTRDKILAITQQFLHKALDIHRGSIGTYAKIAGGLSSPHGDLNFLVLPPTQILEFFLRSYVRNLATYYSLVVAGCVDPNEMLLHNKTSTLLVLLMIAQGAAAVPMAEARYLTAGLTETCRISLFDTIEKNVEISADPVTSRCALLFTIVAAWSGDKWLMDIGMGQRGMYLAMLKHAGLMEKHERGPIVLDEKNVELQWRSWLHQEQQYRLVHNWVMVDQELSLFHDTAPLIPITDLHCSLPSHTSLWRAKNGEKWYKSVVEEYRQSTIPPSKSLFGLFQEFLNGTLKTLPNKPSIPGMQLRLLLHPLQTMLHHAKQMMLCYGDREGDHREGGCLRASEAQSSSSIYLLEVQVQLWKWFEVAWPFYQKDTKCGIIRSSLILYHLIGLNIVTNFPEIERLARREDFDGTYCELSCRHEQCIQNSAVAAVHSGQVMALIRGMSLESRPNWWPAAVYRATMVLWVESIARLNPDYSMQQQQKLPSKKMVNADVNIVASTEDGFGFAFSDFSAQNFATVAMPSPASSSTMDKWTGSVNTTPSATTTNNATTMGNDGSTATSVLKKTSKVKTKAHTPSVTPILVDATRHTTTPPTSSLLVSPFLASTEIESGTTSLYSREQHNTNDGVSPPATLELQKRKRREENQSIIIDKIHDWEESYEMAENMERQGGRGVCVMGGSGRVMNVTKPSEVIRYGMMVMDEGISTRIGDGIKRKLLTLGSTWNVDVA